MGDILTKIMSVISVIRIRDVIDIILVAYIIYMAMNYIKSTRAKQVVKGLCLLLAIMIVANYLNLYVIHFLIYSVFKYGLMAIIVIFYPELRRILEYLGKQWHVGRFFNQSEDKDKSEIKKRVNAISKAVDNMAAEKTGALIIVEQEIKLGEIIDRSTILNAEITSQLIETIFYEGTALHDGAVVLRDDKILAAGCVLPLTTNESLESKLGTRHRAGIGITETTDAVAIIVSEETGIISYAYKGELTRYMDAKSIEKMLFDIYYEKWDTNDSILPTITQKSKVSKS